MIISAASDSLSERGERIELLVNKAEDLTNQSTQFQRQSRDLRRAMFWKNVKMYLLIGGIGFVSKILILGIIFCLCSTTNDIHLFR